MSNINASPVASVTQTTMAQAGIKVPFVDLYAQYLSIKADIDGAIGKTIAQSAYIGGQAVKDFEKAFGVYLQMEHVMSCGNGTDSLEILLKVCGVQPGDEVIVPAMSWISTSEAVSSIGGIPVFVDIEKDHYTMDVALVEKAVTSKTKAIIPVHLYGHPVDMPAIMNIARKHKLVAIEDCAQAHGAKISGQMVGSFGHAASFSFYPGKNLGAYGDAGCMATNDPVIAEKGRMIANHGQKGKHNHQMEGRNSRLDGLQAAILLAKLPHLEKWTQDRIGNAAKYNRLLHNKSFNVPAIKKDFRHTFHLYVIQVEKREEVRQTLSGAGVETFIHYPTALPFLPCYADRHYHPDNFPVAHYCQSRILSIPMFPELTDAQIEYVSALL